jgi:hypothetical protein
MHADERNERALHMIKLKQEVFHKYAEAEQVSGG